MTELLAPAGSPEKLRWAAAYGADAVYFGMKDFSLRSFAGNFTPEEAEEGLKLLHSQGKKGYAALNIYPRSFEYGKVLETAGILSEIGVDAFISADPGVISLLIKHFPKIEMHVSTQANTVSSQTALFYAGLGASRVNLARELSFSEIKRIAEETKGRIETEVFIHGSVCFSYSGRCAISDYLAGRGANGGKCAQSCRWQYSLCEEKRPGEYMPVFEDERGLYLFNSRDLALFRYVPKLIDAGVSSLKIEGRMKNIHYLASVISLYRRLIDGEDIPEEEASELISRVPNRRYSEGFMPDGKTGPDDYSTDMGKYSAGSEFVACGTASVRNGLREFTAKANIYAGETLEMITPDGNRRDIVMPNPIPCGDGALRETVHSCHTVMLDESYGEYALLRRVEKNG